MNKTIIKFFTLAAFTIVLSSIVSCKKKPSSADTSLPNLTTISMTGNDFVFSDQITPDGYTYTELGRQYASVFNVANVINAWNSLSTKKITTLAYSHRYVKFSPATIDELKILVDAKIPLYTFPLDYEIIKAGEFMQDPATEPNGIPSFYTYLPASKEMPAVAHTVLDEVCFLDLRSVVAKKAFELVGELSIYPGDPEPGEVVTDDLRFNLNDFGIHLWPNDDPWLDDTGGGTVDPPPPPPSNPADPRNPPSSVTGACNCSLNSDDRMPSGCIKVEETQWFDGNVRFQGVNDIRADFIGPFGQRLTPSTNEFGCFKANHKIRHKLPGGGRLPVVMSVIFVGTKKVVKGVNHGNVVEFSIPLTHVIGQVQTGGLNNESISYLRSTAIDHNATKWYTSATVNNAIYEFDAYASADGISTLHNDLQVVVHKYSKAAAAPMFNKQLLTGSIAALTISGFLGATTGQLPGAGPAGATGSLADVYIGYKWEDPDNRRRFFTTDYIKERSYHEFAHAIHYKKCGNTLWGLNMAYTINRSGPIIGDNGPYGNLGDPGSGRCALIEMWANYLGRDYAHRRYGPSRHSIVDVNAIFENSWYGESEVTRFNSDYIPSGFLHDLCDNNTYNTANGLAEDGFTTDGCRGYTPSMIFDKMGPTTITAEGLIDKLDDNIPTGTTQAAYNTLRQSYGY